MATVTVNGRIVNPVTTLPASGEITIVLVDYADTPVIGFDTVEQTEVLSPATIRPADDGSWTVQLVPNANIQLTGGTAATAWRVTETGAGFVGTYWIVVPSSGPRWVGDLRTTLVGAQLPSPVANLAISGALTVGGTFTLDGVALASPPSVTTEFLSGDGTWRTPGGGPPSGTAGGDLAGSYPSPSVAKINGIGITGTPSVGATPVATSSSTASWTVISRDQHAAKLDIVLEPFPIETCNNLGLGLSSGDLIMPLARPTSKKPLTRIGMWLCSAGSGPTGPSYVTLLDEAGNRLGISADMTSVLTNPANEGTFIEVALDTSTVLDFDTGYCPSVLTQMSSIPRIAGSLPAAGTFQIPTIRGHRTSTFQSGLSSVPSLVNRASATTAFAAYWIVGLGDP